MTTRLSPADLADLRARNPLAEVAQKFGAVLRREGRRLMGTCPLCGGGKSATRFEVKGEKWVCAVCCEGGDVIKLVQKVTGCSFREAVERLGGVRLLSDDERERLEREAAEKQRKRDEESARYREEERARCLTIWRTAALGDTSDIIRYFEARGLDVPEPLFARAVQSMPYFHGTFVPEGDPYGRSYPRVIHNGPAMLAAMQDDAGAFVGLHITWLAGPSRTSLADGPAVVGKARIFDPDSGERLPSKKMRGSVGAAHINLIRCAAPERLFLGEGNETGLSPWTALRRTRRLRETDGFWAAGSLGALAGRALGTTAHPSLKTPAGRPQRVPGADPDFDAPALTIPASVKELVLLGDGDSDPFTTQLALTRAARRHHRPGLTIRTAFADEAADFNDMMGAIEREPDCRHDANGREAIWRPDDDACRGQHDIVHRLQHCDIGRRGEAHAHHAKSAHMSPNDGSSDCAQGDRRAQGNHALAQYRRVEPGDRRHRRAICAEGFEGRRRGLDPDPQMAAFRRHRPLVDGNRHRPFRRRAVARGPPAGASHGTRLRPDPHARNRRPIADGHPSRAIRRRSRRRHPVLRSRSMTPPDAHHAPARTREEIVEAIIKDAYDRDLFSGVDDDIRTEIEYSWRELASLTPAPPSAPATAEVRERRRFVDWPTGDIVKQLRQQAAEQLDPEYSGFLIAAADRLMSLTAPTTAEVRATFMREIERRRFNVPGDTRWFVRPSDALDALDAVLAALSVAALAGAATFKDGVEAAAKCAEAFHIDDDAMDRQVKRIVAQRIRALTPPVASQDSGVDITNGPQPDGSVVLGAIFRKGELLPETTDVRERTFQHGDRVTKIKGSSWTGRIVGFYSTALTPIGYAVESENEPGSVQIYPESALRTPDIAATGGASEDGLEPPGCPIPGACLCPGGDKHGAEGWRKVAELTEDLAARTRERDQAEDDARCHHDRAAALQARINELEFAKNSAYMRNRDLVAMYDAAVARAEATTDTATILQQRVGALEDMLDTAHGGLICLGASMEDKRWADYARRLGDDLTTARIELDPLSQTPTPNAKTEGV